MISFQRLTGRPREFFGLLEESARLGAEAVRLLRPLVNTPPGAPLDLEPISSTRRRDKEIYNKLDAMLSRIFSTPIEREDLADIGTQLYRLPKTVEKFAERYIIAPDKVRGVDFNLLLGMLERAADIVVEMVRALNDTKNALARVKSLDARLSQIEAEAGHLLLDAERRLYALESPPLSAIIGKDLYDVLAECIEVCQEIGDSLTLAIMKNS